MANDYASVSNICFTKRLGLYEDAKHPKCNLDFTSEISANYLKLRPALYH